MLPSSARKTVLAVLLAAPLIPATASAATYCAPAPCGEDPTHAFATVKAAVLAADAAPGPDLVTIGAGTFNLGEGLVVGASDTSLQGAGRDATILTADPFPSDDTGHGRTIVSGAFPRLSDVTVRLASVVTAGPSSMRGIDASGVLERVRVDAEGAVFGPGRNDGVGQGILLRSGTMRETEVAFDPAADTEGVSLGGIGGTVTLEEVAVTARYGVYSAPQAEAGRPVPVLARRLRLTAVRPLTVGDGSFTLGDALIRALPGAPGEDPAAVALYSGRSPSPAALTLDRVTLVGSGQHGSAALEIGGGAGPVPTRLTSRHLIATGFAVTLRQNSWGGDLETTISHSLADLSPAAIVDETDPAETGVRTVDVATGNRSGDPRFADAAAGDYRLRAGSPAIDLGGEELVAGEATDLGGAPRPADGDGDGVVAADAGAFEHQHVAPVDPGPGPGPVDPGPVCCAGPGDSVRPVVRGLAYRRAAGRRPAALRFTLSERARVAVAIDRRSGRRWVRAVTLARVWRTKGGASIAVRGRAGRGALAAGSYRATLVATDAAGNRSLPRTVRFVLRR